MTPPASRFVRISAAASGALLLAASTPQALGQLVIGTDDPNFGLWLYSVPRGEWRQIATGPGTGAWGLAADDDGGMLYVSSGISLYRISYQTLQPELVGLVIPGGAMVGLAWGHGVLFGVKSTSPRGIYAIDTTTAVSYLVFPVDDALDLGGLDFNVQDGLLYATNDGPGLMGPGLYRIDPATGTVTFVTSYPGTEDEPDIDGLAITRNGRAYLITDKPGVIASYNISLDRYQVAIPSPVMQDQIFAAGAWAPRLVSRVWCTADMSGSVDPDANEYGVPDGVVDASDFFYFLDQFAAGNLSRADLTGTVDPGDPGYGQPDGVLDAADFFYFLDRFVEGCD
ncbi:MAG: hypothetical protein KIT24_04210 [Phycisphaeraceae bacterium]|nr:hypothetical protein [Phycisphaeraceae bacterium]